MKKLHFLLPGLLVYTLLVAQNPASSAGSDDKIISERVFIHTDKSSCIAGDTLWFKAYLFDGDQPGSASTNLFVELIDEQGKLISKQKLPIFDGSTPGFFSITDTLQHGFYFLRAYTPQMLSSGQTISSKMIAVLNIGYVDKKYINPESIEYEIQFFPESGNLITGLTNTVAFKTTDQHGKVINIPVLVNNGSGDTVAYINATDHGMGTFSFVPLVDEKYFAEIRTVAGEKKKFELPIVQRSGVLLSIADNSKGKVYMIQRSPDMFKNEKVKLLGVMFDNIVFRKALEFETNELTGFVSLTDLPAGILHFVVINEKEQVLACRPVIINRTNNQATVFFNKDTVSFLPKAKNVFSVRLPDSVDGNFSVSVIALNASSVDLENNCITNAVLTHSESTLPVIDQPVLNSTGSDKKTNDLYALTGRLSKPIIKQRPASPSDNYITVSGKVYKYGTKKPVTNANLLVYLQTENAPNTFIKVPVDKDGSVKLDGMVFDDSVRFNYQADDKKIGMIHVQIDQPTTYTPDSFRLPENLLLPFDKISIVTPDVKKELAEAKTYFEKEKEKYKLLEAVTVKTIRKKDDIMYNQLFLPEVFVDASSLLNVSGGLLNQSITGTRRVRYFSGGVGFSNYMSVSPGRVINLLPDGRSQKSFFVVKGYAPWKEFKTPDYSKGIYTNEDRRQTLYWNPDLYITPDTREVKIRFFNSDKTTRFKVVIEGYTSDGRFIDFEKIIE